MGRKLAKNVHVDGVLHKAGSEPDKAVAAKITNPAAWGDSAADSDDGSGGYSSMKVADLKAEIDRRNEGRDEADQLSTEGKKDDLVAVLEADDANS